MNLSPLVKTDYYKTEHHLQYPDNLSLIYSNFTPRKSRFSHIQSVVFFGLQHFILEYLIKDFKINFFDRELEDVIKEYVRHIQVDTTHIEDLHELGYLPIRIKALPEGMECPIGVPCMTIVNTHPNFGWLTNYLETLISCMLWQPITSATLAYSFRKMLNKHALETTGTTDAVQWQGHDFSMRGMSSYESAVISGMGHLLSFTGTDTIPSIYQLEESYSATGLIGASVPATEHSVMCMGGKEDEIDTFRKLLEKYPKGILSVVSDTWDLWQVVKVGGYCDQLKELILSREGKLVIRPDSGDPVKILTGYFPEEVFCESTEEGFKIFLKEDCDNSVNELGFIRGKEISMEEYLGVVQLLHNVFGGTVNKQGFIELDSHIGVIYGDSINEARGNEICERLKRLKFASTNWVAGIGSYTYQYNTRDTFGFAMKATYGEVLEVFKPEDVDQPIYEKPVGKEIFKDPITDDGTKKSKKGLLSVHGKMTPEGFKMEVHDQQTWAQESLSLLETVFENGELIKTQTLEEIRNRLTLN